MEVRDVYLQYGILGFIEISKEQYNKRVKKLGWNFSKCVNEMREEPHTTWTIFICYPKRYSDKQVYEKFYKKYEMFSGIVG